MGITWKKTMRTLAVLALMAAGAGARAGDADGLVWVDNQSFGFEACAALAMHPRSEDAQATLAALGESAKAQVARVAAKAGLPLGAAQFVTMTPLAGRFACGADASEATFRVAAVDRDGGRFWSVDLTVAGTDAAPDTTAIAALAADLSGAFRAMQPRAAMR